MTNMGNMDVLAEIEKHADEILHVCSYHRRDFELAVVRSRPHHIQLVQASLQAPFEASSTAEREIMDRLPTELVSIILRELDVRSFFSFRQVSRRARVLATGLWEYQLVSKYGLEGLRGLLRAELADCFTIDDLYQALLKDKCSTCAAFGGLLFLFTLERTCFSCLQSSAKYRVLALTTFGKLARVSRERVNELSGASLRTVPGLYSILGGPPGRRPKHLVYARKGTKALMNMKSAGASAILRTHEVPVSYRFMAATAHPWYSLETAQLERGVSCKGCHVRLEAGDCVMGVRDTAFSSQGFLSHFSQCDEAQVLWAQSEGGTRPVDEPEFTRRGGWLSQLGSDGLPA